MKKSVIATATLAFAALIPATQANAQWMCTAQAKALFGHGPKLGGTRATGFGYNRNEACWSAKEQCEYRLDIKRDRDGFGYPAAKCKRLRARRAVNTFYNH